MADNLSLPQVAANQNQKEVTINDATLQLSGALASDLACDLTSGSATISSTNFCQYMGFIAKNNTGTQNLTFPAIARSMFKVTNNGSGALGIIVGSTTLSLPTGETSVYTTDGTTNGLALAASAGSVNADAVKLQGRNINSAAPNSKQALVWNSSSSDWEPQDIPFDLAFFMGGVPVSSQPAFVPINTPFKIVAGLTGSNFVIGTNPTATMTFTIYKNGSSIGTVAFSTSGVPTVTFTADVSFGAGDLLKVLAPSSVDATGSDIGFNFHGVRI